MRLLLLPCLVAVLALAGCTAGPAGEAAGPAVTAPSSSAPAMAPGRPLVAALVGGFWAVEGADEEPTGARLRFGPISATVFRSHGVIDYALVAQGDQLLVGREGWSSRLGTDARAPWFEEATRLERKGAGWHLLDGAGRTVAVLERGTAPAPSTQYETEATESTTDADRLQDAVPGEDVHQQPASVLQGRWFLAGSDDAFLTFSQDGGWTEHTSCRSGTGADGGAGRYRVLDDGLLLMTVGPSGGVGCSDGTERAPVDVRAITQAWTARSFQVQHGRLTLFDRDGKALGTLVR